VSVAVHVTAVDWPALREEAGLSIGELSEITGLDPATIERLERGGRCSESTRRLVLVALRDPALVKAAIA
jgi:hypothetical protein